ncbi:MAG: lysophospholipid acyltransferase family protein [Myxococcota bacterium]|nr:lysophospholipid acyltransferase family protein [Myxococcota bacterium]
MSPLSGLRRALGDLAGAFVPLSVRELEKTLQDRVRKIPARLNEYGFDPWGLHPETVRSGLLTTLLVYKYYFRVETFGIENVPPGGVLLISNHAGQLPFDGMMISTAMLMEADPPRMVRGMAEYFVGRTPWVSVLASRGGGVAGTPQTCAEMLAAGEAVMAFPEGVRGMNKLYRNRYKLERFGQGFMRLALEADVPIVPISVVGSEDQNPGLANLTPLARALEMPAFPVTPTFPLLGPLGMLPMPVKYRIYFHEPIHFDGAPTDEDAVIEAKVDRVKHVIESGFERGLAEREGVFR